jgi:hypothetical protein
MFTYDRWTVLSYVNIGKIHIYLHEHIALLSYINHVWILENVRASSEEITHLVKIPRYVRFSNFN